MVPFYDSDKAEKIVVQNAGVKSEGTFTPVGWGRRIWVGKRKYYKLSQGVSNASRLSPCGGGEKTTP